MLKILPARLQQYMNRELPDVQAGFRKGRGTRDQIANIRWIIEKVREFQKNINFCFIDYAKAFDCVDHNKLWKILQEMGIPDDLTCLLRNLYASQEATVRIGHGTTDWFQIGKGVCQGCILGDRQRLMKRQVQRSAENRVEAMEGLMDKGLKDTICEDVSVTCSFLVGVDSIQSILTTPLSREDCWPLIPAKLCMVQKSHAYCICRHLSIQKKHSTPGVYVAKSD